MNSAPTHLVVLEAYQRDGVTIIERAYLAYSKPKLSLVNGGWVVFTNETGNRTSVNVQAVRAIWRLANG